MFKYFDAAAGPISLNREREAVRQTTLQKDLEVHELRTKIDRSVESLSKAREGLVEAETSRKHLQERVDELVKQVQMNEEKFTNGALRLPLLPAVSHVCQLEKPV